MQSVSPSNPTDTMMRTRRRWIEAGLLLLAVLLFLPLLPAPFDTDDLDIIFWEPVIPYSDFTGRILPFAVHQTLGRLTLQAWCFRLVNIFLHWLNAVLLGRLLDRLLSNRRAGWMAAVFFISWPFVRGVIWRTSNFSAVAVTTFILLLVISLLEAVRHPRPHFSIMPYVLVILAVATREDAWTILPVILFILHRAPGEAGSRARKAAMVIHSVVCITMICLVLAGGRLLFGTEHLVYASHVSALLGSPSILLTKFWLLFRAALLPAGLLFGALRLLPAAPGDDGRSAIPGRRVANLCLGVLPLFLVPVLFASISNHELPAVTYRMYTASTVIALLVGLTAERLSLNIQRRHDLVPGLLAVAGFLLRPSEGISTVILAIIALLYLTARLTGQRVGTSCAMRAGAFWMLVHVGVALADSSSLDVSNAVSIGFIAGLSICFLLILAVLLSPSQRRPPDRIVQLGLVALWIVGNLQPVIFDAHSLAHGGRYRNLPLTWRNFLDAHADGLPADRLVVISLHYETKTQPVVAFNGLMQSYLLEKHGRRTIFMIRQDDAAEDAPWRRHQDLRIHCSPGGLDLVEAGAPATDRGRSEPVWAGGASHIVP
ncbi:hypothetical protein JW905_00710 [bacterium]|nr:hypothetical protein [candidate division CSSED10-310 bacterium]